MKASEEARRLWPYLLPLVQRSARGALTAGGTITVQPAIHSLSDPTFHSGTLADSQAPQFLLRSGSRSLTGNLAVSAGITIDGVDLSAFKVLYDAHIVNVNAHHNAATAGNGITVSGAQAVSVQLPAISGLTFSGSGLIVDFKTISGLEMDGTGIAIADSVAGGGLYILNKAIGVNVGDGIEIVSDLVQINLQGTSGLDLGAGGLALADTVAGGGLVIASKVMAVNPGDGIDIVTDAVAVDVTDIIDLMAGLGETSNNIQVKRHTDSGLAFNGVSGGLTLGTPISVAAGGSNTNAVTGIQHAHAVTSSSDVGTTAPGVSMLLHATSAGGLVLASLGVKGSVSITNGGDLYVSGTIGGASGVMVTLGDRVGFGRIPDPQFMVDVNGPLRADFLIGKHAIQLDGVLLLSHWDGGDPYSSNYTGEPNGHKGQIGTLIGGAHFRPAKYYKGLTVGPVKTNFVTNPSFETNTTGWSSVNGGTWTRVSTDAAYGSWCVKGVVTGTNPAYVHTISGRTPGEVFVVSAWLKREDLSGYTAFYACNNVYGNAVYGPPVYASDGWKRVSVNYTVDATGTVRIVVYGNAGTYYLDAIQFELDNLSPYIDGSLSDGPGLVSGGHTWSGTAHASSSSRVLASLTYPKTSNILPDRGTIMAWVYVEDNGATSAQGIVDAGSAWPYFALYMTGGTAPTFIAGNASGFATVSGPSGPGFRQWVHVAATWDIYAGQMICYTNGVPGATVTMPQLPSLAANITVGRLATLAGRDLSGYIDDLVITDRVSPPNEVLAVYESDAPVFAESSVFVFRSTPTGLVWADERGLWMRDINGKEVMGMYGGEAATYSWGGKSLEKGDILFGRYGVSNGGWFYWDRNGVSSLPFLSLGYADKEVIAFDAGGASLTGVLDISTNGGIYQGSGSFASPTTGLKIYNSGGAGKISGYNATVEQWYANSDGKLYAGGGDVILDAGGIHISTAAAVGTPANSLNFETGGAVRSYVAGVESGTTNYLYQRALSVAAKHSILYLEAYAPTGKIATVDIGTTVNGVATGGIVIGSGGVADVMISDTMAISQPSTTRAKPLLYLFQADLSEEYFEFSGVVGAGNPIDTAALGAYYGKIRVSVNGAFKYIGLYA